MMVIHQARASPYGPLQLEYRSELSDAHAELSWRLDAQSVSNSCARPMWLHLPVQCEQQDVPRWSSQ